MKLYARKNAIILNMEIILKIEMISILKFSHTKCHQYCLPKNKNNV